MELPAEFWARMARFPGLDPDAFRACYDVVPRRGIRRNPLKCTDRAWASLPYAAEPSPFAPESYYLTGDAPGIGKSPLHHAGAFYVQEPSASSAVTVLAPQPGDRVLDLCAAPGGKSTQIGAALAGRGLLWANEIVPSRAQVLLSNVERMGVRNAVVSNADPRVLCAGLAGFFDRVLVDAPCSGEGMFARDPEAVAAWSPAHSDACAVRQQKILDSAAQAVRTGGVLVYSTCTFSPEENECVIDAFLRAHPDFALADCGVSFGRPAENAFGSGAFDLSLARRIFPMDGGAGHFIAKLIRTGENPAALPTPYAYPRKTPDDAQPLYESLFSDAMYGIPARIGEKLLLLPEGLPRLDHLSVLRAGVVLAEARKNRLEPDHGVFAAARGGAVNRLLDFAADDPSLAAFLAGEEIACGSSGYVGVAVCGAVLGFGKASGGRLKNRYPKGLRNR